MCGLHKSPMGRCTLCVDCTKVQWEGAHMCGLHKSPMGRYTLCVDCTKVQWKGAHVWTALKSNPAHPHGRKFYSPKDKGHDKEFEETRLLQAQTDKFLGHSNLCKRNQSQSKKA